MGATGEASPWAGFTQDPRHPTSAGLRASDRDRDVAIGVLTDGYAEGRLTREEYDERAGAVGAAKTLGELPELIADLVPQRSGAPSSGDPTHPSTGELHQRATRTWEAERVKALTGFLLPTLICWVVWFYSAYQGSGPGYPWPVFVTLGTSVHLVRVQLQRREIIEKEQRRLERKRLALDVGHRDRALPEA